MKRLAILAALFMMFCLAAKAETAWTEVPDTIRPGKNVRLHYTTDGGEIEIRVRDENGETAAILVRGLQADPGAKATIWDGSGLNEQLAEGTYSLELTCGDDTASHELQVGPPAPVIRSVEADETLEDGWTALVDVNMDGTMQVSVEVGGENTVIITQAVEAGENEISWSGTAEELPEGDNEMTFRLYDSDGYSSGPEILPVYIEGYTEPRLATDVEYHTPNEACETVCDHDVCFWKMNMGEMDEDAIWQVLTQPVTVIKGDERKQYKVRSKPDENCHEYVGEITYASQAVHVLERGDKWTLVEAYSSSVEGSSVKVFAKPFRGYVKTSLLQEKQVNQKCGIVIDKLQQRLYVFKEGKLYSTLLCSTGYARADTPYNETPAGEFIAISWTGGFWSGNLFCDKGIRINDGILLHEVPCTIEIQDDGSEKRDYFRCERYLGEKASHGCIRIQKEKGVNGVNASWLWDNLGRKDNTKVIIWDEIGRVLDYPTDNVTLYYNPNGGKQYHSVENCPIVRESLWPLTPFTYGELDDEPYCSLTRCPGCSPQLRREEIDVVNEKNDREPY